MCYTYDSLNRVTARTVKKLSDNSVISTETFTYDAAGNITGGSASSGFAYDTNNRLISFNGNTVSYDLDGNMLSNGALTCTYDPANRLVSAGGHAYTYNADDVRIRNVCADANTTYTYDTNRKLSRLLQKTTNGITTKYVYGRGLIGEEKQGCFKTYHFDCRGSTVALTDASGAITDTFQYDTYGKLLSRTGSSFVIFGYNGRDGVVTDKNGLIYMRARYYSPAMRRFVNADIVPGKITNAVTLNRFAYANGNPVSFVDPFGLSPDNRNATTETAVNYYQAVLVTRFDSEGLKIVGHTQLYFLGDDDVWYCAEFTTSGGDSLKELKGNAQVLWEQKVPPVYNPDKKVFQDAKGSSYVVLNGNFNDSVKLAKQYADPDDDKDFGRYNFLFHNCSDYTNELLDVADIDGMTSQILSEGNLLISIPVLREFELSVSREIDSVINRVSEGLIDAGNAIRGHNIFGDIAGNVLIGTGGLIDVSTNFAGDVVDVVTGVAGEVVDCGKYVAATVTNTIADGVQKVWNFVSFWN